MSLSFFLSFKIRTSQKWNQIKFVHYNWHFNGTTIIAKLHLWENNVSHSFLGSFHFYYWLNNKKLLSNLKTKNQGQGFKTMKKDILFIPLNLRGFARNLCCFSLGIYFILISASVFTWVPPLSLSIVSFLGGGQLYWIRPSSSFQVQLVTSVKTNISKWDHLLWYWF